MNSRLAIGRIIATLLFLILIVLGVWAWMTARATETELATQPARMDVDLSRVGVTEAPYLQSTPLPHGEGVLLDLAGDVGAAEEFKGKLTVVDSAGEIQAESELHLADMPVGGEPARVGGFHPLPRGTYIARLEVITPISGLKGPQRLRIEHELCGLETLPIVVMKLFALVAGAVALVIGAFTAPKLLRHGWRADQ